MNVEFICRGNPKYHLCHFPLDIFSQKTTCFFAGDNVCLTILADIWSIFGNVMYHVPVILCREAWRVCSSGQQPARRLRTPMTKQQSLDAA